MISLSLSLSLSLSHCHMRTQRRWLSANQEENSHRPQPLIYIYTVYYIRVSQVAKNSPANAEDKRDAGSIPGLRRSPGGGHGIPLQYSCLENPMDRGNWWATRVAKSWRWLKRLSMHAACFRVLFTKHGDCVTFKSPLPQPCFWLRSTKGIGQRLIKPFAL